jgi:FKBP-type peptidyl-prolyl cis-trans isomerase SlyD
MELHVDNNQKPLVVADGVVVSMDYELRVDGQVVDSSDESEPLEFLQGHGNIIPGLENQIYGMGIGQAKKVDVVAKDGYGEPDPSAVMEVPKAEFPAEIPMKPGVELQVASDDGEVLIATIVSVSEEAVKLDFNHPLAGKDLSFDVKIVDLRMATEEEMEHGHVHSEDMDEDEEWDEEEWDEEEFDDDEESDDEDEEEEVDEDDAAGDNHGPVAKK